MDVRRRRRTVLSEPASDSSPDEIDDVGALDNRTEVNGERLQDPTRNNLLDGGTSPFCSQTFTREPATVTFTGTPDGVGDFCEPRALLEDGDRMTVGVEGLGNLQTDVATLVEYRVTAVSDTAAH